MGQADQLEESARALDGVHLQSPQTAGAEQAGQQALLLVLLQKDQEVVEHAETRKHADLLERAGDPQPRHPVARGVGQIAAAEEHLPTVSGDITGHAVEQRRLTRAVRADQADELTALDPEVHLVDGRDADEALDQTANLEQRHQPADRGALARRSRLSMPSGDRTTTSSRSMP